MAKTTRRLPFALKAAQPFSVTPHLWRKHLDRDAIAQQDVARQINGAHTTFAQNGFDLVLAVQHLADERGRIFFQHLAVVRAKAYAVVEFFVAGRAVLHWEISLQRRAACQKPDREEGQLMPPSFCISKTA